MTSVDSVAKRTQRVDWLTVEQQLDQHGSARVPAFLTADECAALTEQYDDPSRFRKRVVMERQRFGVGEYQYFAAPLPKLVRELRTHLYQPLARIANQWRRAWDEEPAFPANHSAYLEQCHAAGQVKPTPLLLRYEPGGYNLLHRDLYGDLYFPLQVAVLLTAPTEFDGGEFLLVENRARTQSRGSAIAMQQGELVVFPCVERPVAGVRKTLRAQMRHGVSTVERGHRMTLGIIFHDAG